MEERENRSPKNQKDHNPDEISRRELFRRIPNWSMVALGVVYTAACSKSSESSSTWSNYSDSWSNYSDWDNYSDYSDWSNYSDSYSDYADYGDWDDSPYTDYADANFILKFFGNRKKS